MSLALLRTEAFRVNGSQAQKKTEHKSPGAPGLLPETGRWADKHGEQKRSVLKMAFKGFLNAFLRLPCQIVRTGRRIVVRLLSWNPWLEVLLRGVDALRAMSGSRAAPRGSSPFRPLRC
jgi:hypothetical protein